MTAPTRRAASESQEVFARCEPSVYSAIGSVLNLAVIHEHDPERLLAKVTPVIRDETGTLGRRTAFLGRVVSAALAVGRHDDAREWVDRAGDIVASAGGLPAGTVRVASARADVLLAGDEPGQAAEVARAAVELGDAESVRFDAVRARLVLGRALGPAGDRDGAVAELERVIVDAGRAGAERLVSEAARELRRAGARVTASVRRATAGGDELSERERAIAELVAEGRSNKEVAATLFISGKTVENNLSRIYAKLGVRSRTELARQLRGP